ncbi:MAG TPA: ATP-binding protein [Candidatus Acidoferrales bacterium]|nr:ATP-binding protein [Candidatus Acidoferrales bacterium]
MKNFRRRYPSNYSSVPKARRDVAAFARGCGFHQNDINDITLAVGEACNNAAEHGHVVAGSFSVGCTYEGDEFVVEVVDRGSGFDPQGKGECRDPEKLGMRGLGIFIMRSLMDDICFTMQKAGTTVRLTKYASPRQARAENGVSRNGHLRARLGLAAVHDRLKAFLKLARIEPRHRRER